MEGLAFNRLVLRDFPPLTIVLQLEFEAVLSLVLILPAAPATVRFNIGLVTPLVARLTSASPEDLL